MVYSASSYEAFDDYGDAAFYMKKQLIANLMGLTAMIVVAMIPYQFWKRFAVVGYVVSAILIVLVKTPLGVASHGAYRWIKIPGIGFNLQPAEVAKLCMILFLAVMVCKMGKGTVTMDAKGYFKNYGTTIVGDSNIIEQDQFNVVISGMYISNYGDLVINNSKLRVTESDYPGIFLYGDKNKDTSITINNSEIISKSDPGIKVSDNIAPGYGQGNRTIKIISGLVSGSKGIASDVSCVTVEIGEDDKKINYNTPVIKGEMYGISGRR